MISQIRSSAPHSGFMLVPFSSIVKDMMFDVVDDMPKGFKGVLLGGVGGIEDDFFG